MHTRWPGSGVPFGPIRGPRARTRPGFLRPIVTGILVERPTAANGGCDDEWPLWEDLPVAVTLIPPSRESRQGCDKPARPPCGTRFLHKSSPDSIQEKPRVPRPTSHVPRPGRIRLSRSGLIFPRTSGQGSVRHRRPGSAVAGPARPLPAQPTADRLRGRRPSPLYFLLATPFARDARATSLALARSR